MELDKYDFVEIGEWKLKKGLKSGITFKLNKFEDERVIYAFVVEDKVKYIGVCENSTTTIKDRISRYKSLQGAGTNERIAGKIKDCLKDGRTVRIFALKPKSTLLYKDLKIDLIKGLENPLIKKLNPEWNIQK